MTPRERQSGNDTHDETDLTLPARGIPIVYARTYHSYFPTGGGHLGTGWIHSYADHIRRTPTGILFVSEAGEWAFHNDGVGGYLEPAGFQGRITEDAAGFTFTHRDGRADYFDTDGRLTAQTDLNGNLVSLQYAADGRLATVTDTTGRVVLTFSYDVAGNLSRVTDVAGRSVSYAHDAAGHLTAVTNVLGDTRSFGYDDEGRMTARTDYRGNGWTLSYDARGRWVRTEDPLGHSYRATYDDIARRAVHHDRRGAATVYEMGAQGEMLARVDALGNRTEMTYDARLNTTEVVDARGAVTSYEYDADDNTVRTISPRGVVTENTYGAHNRLTQTVDDLGGLAITTTNSFDAAGNLIATTDPNGAVTTMAYDASGQPTSMTRPGGATSQLAFDATGNMTSITDPAGGVTAFAHNAAGHMTSMTDALGRTTTMEVDAAGRTLAQIDAVGNRTTSLYDADGNLLTSTDAAGNVSTHVYDALGRRTATTDALGQTESLRYDGEGAIVERIDADGGVWTTEYDILGRQLAVTDPSGAAMRYGYCAEIASQPCDIVDALGHLTTFTFDEEGRTLSQTDPLGLVTHFSYDALGRQTATTDPSGRTTQQVYDPAGRVIAAVDEAGFATTYAFDGRGNRLSYTDANGHTTSFAYDLADRMITQVNPLGNATQFAYDAAGQMTDKLDANGNLVTYHYDDRRQLIERRYADGTVHAFEYDERGLRTREVSPSIERTYTYDALGRLETVSDHRFSPPKVLRYGYDARGNRTSMALEPDNRITRYRYDRRGLLSELIDPDGDPVRYDYDELGRRTAIRYPNRVTGTYTYNDRSEITGIVWARHTGQILSASLYTYDARGNRTSKTYEDGGTEHYGYDATSRLTEVTYPGGERHVTYDYDPVGNRLRMVETTLADADQPALGCNPVLDTDCDGVANELDNCPTTHNADQANSDGDQFTDTFDTAASLADYDIVDVTGTSDWLVTSDGRLGQRNVSLGSARTANTYLLRQAFDDEGSLRLAATFEITDQNSDHGAGFVFRYQDPQNTYRFLANPKNSYRRLDKIEDGVITVLAEIAGSGIGYDKQARFAVEADGPVLRVTQGDSVILTAEDATFATGRAGLFAHRAAGARFDDAIATNADPSGDACDACPDVADPTCAPVCDDLDGDGYGSAPGACGQPQVDCAPANADIGPEAAELCDGIDNDCDGRIDERCDVGETLYAYNGFNQLLESADDDGLTAYSYDLNGNQVEQAGPDGVTSYLYDLDDRMVELQQPSGTSVFAYAPDGIMVARDVGDERGARDLVVDVQQQVEIAEYNGNDSSSFHTFSPAAIDELVSTSDRTIANARKHYGLVDALNSVVGVADDAGFGSATRRYDAFGSPMGHTNANSEGWAFAGRQWPMAGGEFDALGYYRQRWYAAGSGRFMQADRLLDVDGPNTYAYVTNNPVGFVDPRGTWLHCAVGAVAGVAFIWAGARYMSRALRPYLPDVFEIGFEYLMAGIAIVSAICAYKHCKKLRGSKPKALKFGDNDLVYGPSAGGRLAKLAERSGGRTLTSLEKPAGVSIETFSVQTMRKARQAGSKIHFDLTHMKDVKGVLAGKSHVTTVTSYELHYLRDHWNDFSSVTRFYRKGRRVRPPWKPFWSIF